jgi:hypothetical protein
LSDIPPTSTFPPEVIRILSVGVDAAVAVLKIIAPPLSNPLLSTAIEPIIYPPAISVILLKFITPTDHQQYEYHAILMLHLLSHCIYVIDFEDL